MSLLSCEGASLVVVYENLSMPQKQILIYDGNALIDAFESLNQTITNFIASNPVTEASVSYVVADGQIEFDEEVFFNGTSIALNPFDAIPEGDMQDTETYDVNSLVAGNSTSVTTNIVGNSDCLVIDAIVFAVSSSAVDCPWLSENPTSGTIPPENSQNVDVIVDATGLLPGTYNCNMNISSNDPDENPVVVPVTLNVIATGLVFRVERATGDVFAAGSFITDGADLAERINVSERVEPGDVVELDPANPGYYRKARGSSRLIAGVITTEPGFILGNSLEEIESGKVVAAKARLTFEATNQPMLVLLGRVPVKVTTDNGPILPGDLLTVSNKRGYTMLCAKSRSCEGAIIGKALESLETGDGVILVLVMSH